MALHWIDERGAHYVFPSPPPRPKRRVARPQGLASKSTPPTKETSMSTENNTGSTTSSTDSTSATAAPAADTSTSTGPTAPSSEETAGIGGNATEFSRTFALRLSLRTGFKVVIGVSLYIAMAYLVEAAMVATATMPLFLAVLLWVGIFYAFIWTTFVVLIPGVSASVDYVFDKTVTAWVKVKSWFAKKEVIIVPVADEGLMAAPAV